MLFQRIIKKMDTFHHGLFLARFSRCLCISVVIIVFSSSFALAADDADELRVEVETLKAEVSRIEQENRGLRLMLKELEDDDIYIVVDTESNRLQLRQGTTVLHTAKCGTGSRSALEAETGTNWQFETPLGSFTVLGKERNPVWIRPDWSYVEENMPIPAKDDPDRLVREVLGKYALLLGNGYKIHGTKWTSLLGTHFTHGCVSLGDDDLELVYKTVKIGTRVYLY